MSIVTMWIKDNIVKVAFDDGKILHKPCKNKEDAEREFDKQKKMMAALGHEIRIDEDLEKKFK